MLILQYRGEGWGRDGEGWGRDGGGMGEGWWRDGGGMGEGWERVFKGPPFQIFAHTDLILELRYYALENFPNNSFLQCAKKWLGVKIWRGKLI